MRDLLIYKKVALRFLLERNDNWLLPKTFVTLISNLSEYPKFHFKNRLKFTGNVLYIYDGFYGYHYDV